jgi:hypothetical protein
MLQTLVAELDMGQYSTGEVNLHKRRARTLHCCSNFQQMRCVYQRRIRSSSEQCNYTANKSTEAVVAAKYIYRHMYAMPLAHYKQIPGSPLIYYGFKHAPRALLQCLLARVVLEHHNWGAGLQL